MSDQVLESVAESFCLWHGYWWQNVLICRQHRRLGTDILCLWAKFLISKAERFERIDSACPIFNPGVFQPSKLKHVLVSVSEKPDFQKLDLSRTQNGKFWGHANVSGMNLSYYMVLHLISVSRKYSKMSFIHLESHSFILNDPCEKMIDT